MITLRSSQYGEIRIDPATVVSLDIAGSGTFVFDVNDGRNCHWRLNVDMVFGTTHVSRTIYFETEAEARELVERIVEARMKPKGDKTDAAGHHD